MGIFCSAQKPAIDLSPTPWHTFFVRLKSDQERSHMPMNTHLVELEKRHQALEDELAEVMAHPSADDLKIAELKRRKLQLKDEITRLQHTAGASVH
jgi:hypothetical protein